MANNIVLAGIARAALTSGVPVLATTEVSQDVHILKTQTVSAAGTSSALAADNADAVAVSATADKPVVLSRNTIFGTAWDRQRAVVNATNSVGTGIVAAGLVAQLDDTAPTAITENQFGNVRMNSARALYAENGPYTIGRATADTQIKATAGFIHTVSISPSGSVTAGVLTIYDSAAESGTVLAVYSLPVTTFTPFSVTFDCVCATGIFVGFDATLANVSASVSFR